MLHADRRAPPVTAGPTAPKLINCSGDLIGSLMKALEKDARVGLDRQWAREGCATLLERRKPSRLARRARFIAS